jgi:predicted O-linked N-acetylglucosamine transferase (SPINDLY family)
VKPQRTTADLLERALAHHRAGRAAEAESSYRKVLAKKPQHAKALFMLSGLFFEAERFEEASGLLERLVAVEPHPAYLTNLGEAYRRQGALDAAAAACERALAEDPDLPEAHHNLGLTLMNAGAPGDARAHLERAVALRADNPQFHVSFAWALLGLSEVEASIAHCRRALALAPNLAAAHHHLANALVEVGDRKGAIASYRRAVELDPTDAHAHSNLILVALTDPGYDAGALGAEARAWAKLHAAPLRAEARPDGRAEVRPHGRADVRPHEGDRDPGRRLRVGYVSPDLRAHPVRQFLMPVLHHHDRSAFDIYLYASVERPDDVTAEYRALAGENFRDIRRLDDARAAELVRRDRIDILVDLAVHGAGHRLRLFARRPAPVQMTWLGYAGTTGLDAVDFRLSDPFLDPPGTDLGVYAEETLRLPETFWCYEAPPFVIPVGPLPALAAGFVTFGCLGSARKIHDGVLALWARVLAAVPRSRLLMVAEAHAREGIRRAFAAAGVEADRIEFTGRVSHRQYLELHHRIDVGLDTFPFAGGTTTLDAAWMGVPVLTLSGGTVLHRAGVTIAMNLGLPDLALRSPDELVARATELAGDLDHLRQLRGQLRARLQGSPLMNAPRFAGHLEAAYRTAWERRGTHTDPR